MRSTSAAPAARLPKFTDYLAERLHVPVRLHNPFAGLAGRPAGRTDGSYAQLPSAWCGSLGLRKPVDDVPLDVLEEVRAERRAFWQTAGARCASAAAAAAIIVLRRLLQVSRMGVQSSASVTWLARRQ